MDKKQDGNEDDADVLHWTVHRRSGSEIVSVPEQKISLVACFTVGFIREHCIDSSLTLG